MSIGDLLSFVKKLKLTNEQKEISDLIFCLLYTSYYFWVEDAAGNADYRSITINNIVVQATTSTTVRSESRNTVSYTHLMV